MIRINLLPLREGEQALRRRQQVSVSALAISLLVLLMVIPYVWQKRTLSRLDGEINELTAEVAKYDEQTKEARDLDKKKKDLEAKLGVIKDLDLKRVGPSRVLADLSAAVPEKLWLEEFSETHGAATLIGWALDNQTVAVFMRQLAASPYFYNVDLSEATQPEQPADRARSLVGDGGFRLKRFVIKASLDYFGRGGKPAKPEENGKRAQPPKGDT